MILTFKIDFGIILSCTFSTKIILKICISDILFEHLNSPQQEFGISTSNFFKFYKNIDEMLNRLLMKKIKENIHNFSIIQA